MPVTIEMREDVKEPDPKDEGAVVPAKRYGSPLRVPVGD
jgi:hypothetical protein